MWQPGLRPGPHQGLAPGPRQGRALGTLPLAWLRDGRVGGWRRTGDRQFDASHRPAPSRSQAKEESRGSASGGGPGGKAPWRGLGQAPAFLLPGG